MGISFCLLKQCFAKLFSAFGGKQRGGNVKNGFASRLSLSVHPESGPRESNQNAGGKFRVGVQLQAVFNDMGIFPVQTKTGISVMSLNLLLENSTDPVVWRGPVIAGAVKQFWTDVIWNDVDYMFVDMPPGTGDVPLTVFQSIPVDGIIVVTSPQDLVSMIVEKAVKMAGLMNIPVLGIVENMSYFVCPDCGKKHFIFGESKLEKIAEAHNIKNIARLPVNPKAAAAADGGKAELLDCEALEKMFEAVKEL